MAPQLPKKKTTGRKPNPKKSTPEMRRIWREKYYERKKAKALGIIFLIILCLSSLTHLSIGPANASVIATDTDPLGPQLAPNWARTMARQSDGDLYVTYMRGDGKITVHQSIDNGGSWINETLISDTTGAHSTIAVDSLDNLHVFWYKDTDIYYSNFTTSWSDPSIILTGITPVIAIDSNDYLNLVYERSDQIYYSKYTTSWSSPLRISTYEGMQNYSFNTPSIAMSNGDNIHVAFSNTTTIWYAKYDGDWNTPVLIRDGISGLEAWPSIATDSNSYVHIVWTDELPVPNQTQVWYRSYKTSWGSAVRLSTYPNMNNYVQWNPTIACDESDYIHVMWHGNADGYNTSSYTNIWYANYTTSWSTPVPKIPKIMTEGPNLRWSFFNMNSGNMDYTYDEVTIIDAEWDILYGIIWPPSLTITNMDADDWVFEGKKRYDFQVTWFIETLNTVEQVGIRFTDEIGDVHIIWYDPDANTLTVTSPNDGISGWLSSLEQSGDNVIATFQIMFNNPIPDSYDVQADVRLVTEWDTGWTVPDGDIFSIYNLGGLSTLTDSGMAGRNTGGDIFEIYAADTTTPILVYSEGFEVERFALPSTESEEDLLEEIDWIIHMPRRESDITMYPTSRVKSTSAQDKRAYHSGNYGFRIIDNNTDANRNMYIEKNFRREIDSTDDEIVIAQFHMMGPDVGSSGTPGAGGEIRVMDQSIHEEGSAYMALQLRFNSSGYMTAYNDTSSAWDSIMAVTDFTWYNITGVFNLTSQTVDVYVETVLKMDDLPFVDTECTSLKTLWIGRSNSAVVRNDFYVDDIRAWTDWDKDYGGQAKATMLFNQLQHWSMDFDIFVESGQEYAQGPSGTGVDYSDHGYWEFGWDVMLDGTWIEDFLVARVNITDGRINKKNSWIQYNITWYSQGSYVKNDFLYGLFEGYSIFDDGNKDTSGFHWDIWFNRANASTIIGARINTEYYGMSDKSVWWAIWSSDWTPMRTEESASTIFVDLEDADSAIQSAKDVTLVRSYVKVLRTSEAEFSYKIKNIAGLDFPVARDTMSGIDTPPVRETMIKDVMSGFLGSALGGIFSAALKRLGNALSGFGMNFFTMSIDFIDNIFAALGYPALVATIFGWMDSLFSYVPTLLGFGMTMIGNVYTLINTSASDALTQVTGLITIWAGMYATLQDLITDVYTPGLNLWNDLGVNSFIQVAGILYPFWLYLKWSEEGSQAVFDHLNSILNIGSFFLNFILNIGGFFMNLLTALIGAIRG